ncbi:hypothetical protein LWC34_15335 [Kibdelosporangium philippinense]|uniref:Ig-like domain (Group 3) n=1 Tax=Kibdelosporangium philippinense TaxID=211113 RepID=A0ABS8ZAY9_9PSEU|nr:hypothetical protein [Kibdelosporangium philippinense]MCE7004198.1 hypothetical protein [Kibdelosporangium philippinense]
MFRRLIAGVAGALMATSIVVAVPASALPAPPPVPAPAPSPAPVAAQAQEQVLEWTTDDDRTRYLTAPSGAVAGPAKFVFVNASPKSATPHTLTFDTDTPGYNHDVTTNVYLDPFDPEANGRWEGTVTLTPGKYRYFCALPGHVMSGEFTVTSGEPDTTPPVVNATVTGTKDTNGNYVGKATVAVSASDNQSGVKTVEYQIDDQSWLPYTQPFDVTAIGDHSVQYRATDNAGNVSPTGSQQFRVVETPPDSTPPTVNATVAGDKDPQGNYINKATVTITATDAQSGVKSIEYKVDNGNWTPYTVPVEVTGAGMRMVSYRATDNANNVSPEGMAHIVIVAPRDTTPPTVNATVAGDKDPQGNYINKATVTVTATDAGGIKSTEYKLDSGAWTAYTAPVEVSTVGAHTVAYRATDNANNVSPEGSVNFTVAPPRDTTAPTTNATVAGDRDPNGNYIGKATVTVTATDASGIRSTEYKLDSGAWTAYTTPVEVTAVGAHTLSYRATDNAGNVAAEKSVNFTVAGPPDTTPPTVNAAVAGDKDPNGNYIGKATVTITATDASGIKSTEYKLDSGNWTAYTTPVEVTGAGAHTVAYRATDNANNVSPEGTAIFTIITPPDTTAPAIDATVTGPKDPNGNFIGSASVTVTASDAQSGVKLIEYSLDNGAWQQYLNTVQVTAKGAHTVKYRASDNAGNAAPEKAVAFTVVEQGSDACPNSDTRETVIIKQDNTGVANVDTGNGCTVSDLVDQNRSWPSHGEFVRHVDTVTSELVTRGVLSRRDAGTIVRAASRSDIGN